MCGGNGIYFGVFVCKWGEIVVRYFYIKLSYMLYMLMCLYSMILCMELYLNLIYYCITLLIIFYRLIYYNKNNIYNLYIFDGIMINFIFSLFIWIFVKYIWITSGIVITLIWKMILNIFIKLIKGWKYLFRFNDIFTLFWLFYYMLIILSYLIIIFIIKNSINMCVNIFIDKILSC